MLLITFVELRVVAEEAESGPKAGRSPIGRLSTAVLCRDLENGMVGAGHGRGMLCESAFMDTPQEVSGVGQEGRQKLYVLRSIPEI
jgi:hypothetical protein